MIKNNRLFQNILNNRYFLYLFVFLSFIPISILLNISPDSFVANGSDELYYYKNIDSFVINGSTSASFTYNTDGSKIGGADAHGPAYSFLNGIIVECFGFKIFPYINLLFYIIILFAILLFKPISINNRLLFMSLLNLLVPVWYYLFGLYQETINLLFGLLSTFLIYKIYTSNEIALNKNILIFCTCLLIFSLFRISWLFFTIALLPLSKNRKQFIYYTTFFIFSVLVSFLLSNFLFEQLPSLLNKNLSRIVTGEYLKAFYSFAYSILVGLKHYFINFKDNYFFQILNKYLFFYGIIYLLNQGLRKKDTFALALGLSSVLIFLLNLLLITNDESLRYLSFIYLFLVAYAILRNKKFLILVLLLTELICLPNAFIINNQILKERSIIADQYKSDPTYPQIKRYLTENLDSPNKAIRVLIDYSEYDDFRFLMALPVKSRTEKPIKYAIRYYNNDFDSNKMNYCITKPGETPKLFQSQVVNKIFEHKYFDLYEIHFNELNGQTKIPI
jgi:hypothetical protein